MATIAPGSKLSHFEILEKLGEGGMGVVYKARDLRLDRLVAIKVLPEKAVANAEREARFIQEAKAASALNHANIITVHEIDSAGDVTFIAMEYVDGRTLDQVIPRKGLRFTDALKYAVQITDALAAAHNIGIVHRDLKPANVMITGKGLAKVLDFGLAKLMQPAMVEESASQPTVSMAPAMSEQGSILGTVAYMSPEQAEGKPVDARSDIFSFGIVLYEMLTGRRPFTGDTNLSTRSAIVNQEPKPAGELVEDLPHDLDRILARCLRKDPSKRFQHMADLHVALEELKDESDSGRLTATAPLKRNPKRVSMWAAVVGLSVLAIAGVWLVTRFAEPSPPQRVVAVTTYAGSEQQPSLSHDGNQVAFSWNGPKEDNFDIYVKLIGETNALRLTSDSAADTNPSWSPDGKRIAFERAVSDSPVGVYMVSPLAGAEQKLTDFPARGQMSWTPDGKWLAVSSNATEWNGVFLLPLDGGEPRRIILSNAPVFDEAVSFAPDGRSLAYAACNSPWSCDLYVQELDSSYAPRGSARRITTQGFTSYFDMGVAWSRDGKSLIYSGSLTSPLLSYLWRARISDSQVQRLEIAGPSAFSPAIASSGGRIIFSKWVGNRDIWRYRVDGAMEPLITSSVVDMSPQFSPDGSKIAFDSNRSGDADQVWVANADGSNPVQITSRLGRYQGTPSWSPDGRWIAFDSQGQDGTWQIYVVDATGGRPRRITSEGLNGSIPSWSRDGKWIYFMSDRTGREEIWRVSFPGGAGGQITDNGGHTPFESADGKTLFYTKADSSPLFGKALSAGPERQVLPGVTNRAFVPVEDGIYYIGQRDAKGRFPIQFFRFSTERSELLTNIDGDVFLGLSVSPDRKTILFTKTVASGADLMMIENFR